MTQTKLEIIGPYTPEHEGPFCTRSKVPVDLKYRDGRGEYTLGGYLGPEDENITTWAACGKYNSSVITPHPKDLMNAREVPVAREFWINEYVKGGVQSFSFPYPSPDDAMGCSIGDIDFIRTIHVREVLPESDQ